MNSSKSKYSKSTKVNKKYCNLNTAETLAKFNSIYSDATVISKGNPRLSNISYIIEDEKIIIEKILTNKYKAFEVLENLEANDNEEYLSSVKQSKKTLYVSKSDGKLLKCFTRDLTVPKLNFSKITQKYQKRKLNIKEIKSQKDLLSENNEKEKKFNVSFDDKSRHHHRHRHHRHHHHHHHHHHDGDDKETKLKS